ncbi:MAG: two-component system, LytTR family, response regulator [Acidobacteriaceae bacterium]|nr:two-component system, LytTR family, response regulator [Acidobacteriaceae bacterium]
MQAKVLIVDDEPLARDRIREMLRGDREIQIVGEARNGCEAIEAMTAHAPDIVFLDVQMPDMDGFEVLKTIRVEHMPLIIFVTAYDQHALRAFDVHAIDYLMKPFDRKRFAKALDHAKDQTKHPKDEPDTGRIMRLLEELKAGARYVERFAIKTGEKVLFVRAEDVDSIEADGNYVRLTVSTSSYMLRETINGIESQIDPRMFVRIHRSTIVNMNRVKELQAWARGEYRIMLDNGVYHTLSRGYREHFDNFIKNR